MKGSQCIRQALGGEKRILKALGAQDDVAQGELTRTTTGHDSERCRPAAFELSKNAEVAACEHAELKANACAHKQAITDEARLRMLEAEASLARSRHALEVCSHARTPVSTLQLTILKSHRFVNINYDFSV